MQPADPTWRSSLLISCPEAEAVVGVHRDRLDRSARFGVPAHLTVGHVIHGQDASLDELRTAEADVRARLPVRVDVTHVELWAGPPLDGPVGPGWHKLEEFALG